VKWAAFLLACEVGDNVTPLILARRAAAWGQPYGYPSLGEGW